MAELIPLEYRIAVSQKRLARRWGFISALALAVAVGGLVTAWRWQHKQYLAYAEVKQFYDHRAMIKVKAKSLIDQREDMANRMARLEEVQNDQTMLLLMQNITREFSDEDMLEDITLEVHGKLGEERNPPGSFTVIVNGITKSNITLSTLVSRLSKAGAKSIPAMRVQPGSSSTGVVMGGNAVRFHVTFDRAATKSGGDVTTAGAR